MKITKSKLTQIIKEELGRLAVKKEDGKLPIQEAGSLGQHARDSFAARLGPDAVAHGDDAEGRQGTNLEGEPYDNPGGGEKLPDVEMILRYFPRIDKSGEYVALFKAVLQIGITQGKIPNIMNTLQAISDGDQRFYEALKTHLKLMQQRGIAGKIGERKNKK